MNKTLLVAAFSLVLVGAGCSGGEKTDNKVVEGDWILAFDLPEEWVMVAQYDATGDGINLEKEITRSDSDVVLQSTNQSILNGSGAVPDDLDMETVVTENFVEINATHLDARRVVPSEGEDLGNGFSKLKLCEDGGDCQNGSSSNYEYYYQTEEEKFKFTIDLNGRELTEAENVILSAQVTVKPVK